MKTFAFVALIGAVLAHPHHDEKREELSIGEKFDEWHKKGKVWKTKHQEKRKERSERRQKQWDEFKEHAHERHEERQKKWNDFKEQAVPVIEELFDEVQEDLHELVDVIPAKFEKYHSLIEDLTDKPVEYHPNMGTKYMEYLTFWGKSYMTTEEFAARKALFIETDAIIEAHNKTDSRFKLGHNKFSDYTEHERSKLSGGAKKYNHVASGPMNVPNDGVPSSVDWRDQGAVTPVKNQAACGSCWAFSAVGALEGANFIKTGTLTSFSEQQQVSCNTSCYGCGGGWSYKAFDFWKSNNAFTEDAYPYTSGAGDSGTCEQASLVSTDVGTTGHFFVTEDNIDEMKAAVAQQPVSVSIEADKSVFQLYSSGVFDSTACGTNTDHATLVVGYASDSDGDYWIMKNSWGTSWGEDGYMRVAIVAGEGICAIQSSPVYP